MVGCIDIGSNTTRLLVAEVRDDRLHAVDTRRAFTRIGAHIGPDGRIPEPVVAAVAAVTAEFAQVATGRGAQALAVVATAAVRRCANPGDLAAAVVGACGHPMRILSGDEEAAFSFAGASHVVGGADEPLAVVDVGGGSTEIAVGTSETGVQWSRSVDLGSSSLRLLALDADPPSEAELTEATRHATEALGGMEPPRAAAAVAVGGTATALFSVAGPLLDRATLTAGLRRICAAPAARLAPELGLPVERVLLLPAGVTLLCAAIDALGTELRVVAGGLREGVALELAGAA